MSQEKTKYLGDGVYVEPDEHGGIWLLANDHINPTDRIYLEPEVFRALMKFKEGIK